MNPVASSGAYRAHARSARRSDRAFLRTSEGTREVLSFGYGIPSTATECREDYEPGSPRITRGIHAIPRLVSVRVEIGPFREDIMPPTTATPERSDRAADQSVIRPFQVNVPEADVADLRSRLQATRWPTKELVTDRSQGVQLATLRELARYWTAEYDWRKC